MRAIVIALPCIVLAALIMCCSKKPPVVEIIIPEGFRGMMRIQMKEGAPELKEDRPGRYSIQIPATGFVEVESIRVFEEWHQVIVRTSNGAVIKNAVEQDDMPSANQQDSYVWNIPAGQKAIVYLLGSRRERDFLLSNDESKWPSPGVSVLQEGK